MFAISDELARAFTSGDQENLSLKLQDFETRKASLVKKINNMLNQEQVLKFKRKFEKERSRSGS